MGVVRRHFDQELKRYVAIKCLLPELVEHPDRRARLEREAQALAALDHPNIVAVFGLFLLPPPDGPQIVMQYVEGEDLERRLEAGPLPVEEAARIGAQIAFALEAAHTRGFVHRDLKPGNVMLTATGLVKVVDFGLAVRQVPFDANSDTATVSRLSLPGQIVGTPGYMSPEQCRGGEADPRADLWALGCILFECLVGMPAFGGASAVDRIAAALTLEPDFSVLPPDTPAEMRYLLEKCLTKAVELRNITAGDAREILVGVAEGRPGRTPFAPPVGEPPPNNIPQDTASFIGRRDELKQLHELLSSQRLITMTALSGFGKTRLARRVARESAGRFDRVVLSDLLYVTDPAEVGPEVARAMGARGQPNQEAAEVVAAAVGTTRTLLVLDHGERVLDACARLVQRVLAQCPRVKVLVASARALGLPGEQRFSLAPMPCPEVGASFAETASCESVQLLVDRARLVAPRFCLTPENAATLAEICRQHEGVPLAIELSARLMRSITPSELLPRIHRSARSSQDPLGGAFAASYALLKEEERAALQRVSVFRGGWTLEAGDDVIGDAGDALTLMDALVEASLVSISFDAASTRYRLLESIRILAAEELNRNSGEGAAARRRHLQHFLGVAEKLEPGLLNGVPDAVSTVALELENLRAALEYDACDDTDPSLGVRLATAMYRYWYLVGQYGEGRRYLEAALQRRSSAADAVQAAGLNALGVLALGARDQEGARTRFIQSMEMSRSLGDLSQVAGRLSNLGIVAEQGGQLGQARACHEEALGLYTKIDDGTGAAKTRLNLAVIAHLQGSLEEALSLYKRCLADFARLGDQHREAIIRHNLGELHWTWRRYGEAAQLFAESRRMRWQMKDWPGVVFTLHWEAFVAEQRDLPSIALLAVEIAAAVQRRNKCASAGDPPEPVIKLTARLRSRLADDPSSAVSEDDSRSACWEEHLRELDASAAGACQPA